MSLRGRLVPKSGLHSLSLAAENIYPMILVTCDQELAEKYVPEIQSKVKFRPAGTTPRCRTPCSSRIVSQGKPSCKQKAGRTYPRERARSAG